MGKRNGREIPLLPVVLLACMILASWSALMLNYYVIRTWTDGV